MGPTHPNCRAKRWPKHTAIVIAICIICISCAPAIVIPPAQSNVGRPGSQRFGFVTHRFTETFAAPLVNAGGGIARIDANWMEIQPTDRASWDWRQLDVDVATADAHQIRLFVTLAYTPRWANAAHDQTKPPDSIADWQAFVTAFVRRYPTVHDVGLWNEPNLSDFYTGSLADWVMLVKAGAASIRLARQDVKVYGPETSSSGFHGFDWFDVGMAQVRDVVDGVTVHWYDDGNDPLEAYLDRVHAAAGGKSIWLTEVGEKACDSTKQARLYQRVFVAAGTRSWLTAVFFYDLIEPAATSCSWPPAAPALAIFQDAVRKETP